MKKKIIGIMLTFLLAAALIFGIPALQVLNDGTVQVEENLNVEGSMNVDGSLTVNGVENASVPKGAIIMWAGTEIPPGWALCDGQNETPDLRDRFIVGAGSSYNIGNTGGSEAVSLTTAQLPSHSHPVNDPGHSHTATVNDPGHQHTATVKSNSHDNDGRFRDGDADGHGNSASVSSSFTGVTVSISSRATGISIENTGEGNPHENRPPYYALAFIIKL